MTCKKAGIVFILLLDYDTLFFELEQFKRESIRTLTLFAVDGKDIFADIPGRQVFNIPDPRRAEFQPRGE